MPYTVSSSTDAGTAMSFIQTGVRTYFPRIGRYMQVDPIKDGINFLAYSDNNLVNKIDPTGKIPVSSCEEIEYFCMKNAAIQIGPSLSGLGYGMGTTAAGTILGVLLIGAGGSMIFSGAVIPGVIIGGIGVALLLLQLRNLEMKLTVPMNTRKH